MCPSVPPCATHRSPTMPTAVASVASSAAARLRLLPHRRGSAEAPPALLPHCRRAHPALPVARPPSSPRRRAAVQPFSDQALVCSHAAIAHHNPTQGKHGQRNPQGKVIPAAGGANRRRAWWTTAGNCRFLSANSHAHHQNLTPSYATVGRRRLIQPRTRHSPFPLRHLPGQL
jgi:hypothetical protein